MSTIVDSSDCPYKCRDGKVFDQTLGYSVPCPNCGEKYRAIANGKSKSDNGKTFEEIMRIPLGYRPSEYSLEKTIPDTELMTQVSIDEVERFLKATLNQAVLGEKPRCSFYVNLGRNADILNFLHSYLRQCFKNSLTVLPILSSTDLIALRASAEGIETDYIRKVLESFTSLELDYHDFETSDICVVTMDAGITKNGVYAVKGLLEARDRRGLPTLVFTNAFLYNDMKSQILSYNKAMCYHLLYPVEVQYMKVEVEETPNSDDKEKDKEVKVTSIDVNNSTDKLGSQKSAPVSEITNESLMSIINATNIGGQDSL